MAEAVYSKMVTVLERYLGPAAQRFVDRQITFHLNKEPQAVEAGDIPQLTDWIRVSLALLTDDHKIIDECSERLAQLSYDHDPTH